MQQIFEINCSRMQYNIMYVRDGWLKVGQKYSVHLLRYEYTQYYIFRSYLSFTKFVIFPTISSSANNMQKALNQIYRKY